MNTGVAQEGSRWLSTCWQLLKSFALKKYFTRRHPIIQEGL
jgi:hypothetical protein